MKKISIALLLFASVSAQAQQPDVFFGKRYMQLNASTNFHNWAGLSSSDSVFGIYYNILRAYKPLQFLGGVAYASLPTASSCPGCLIWTTDSLTIYASVKGAWSPWGGAGGGGGSGISGSGTQYFVPVFTGTAALGNSDIMDSAGYIGIGGHPDATGTWGLVQLFKNSRFNCWNGSTTSGYIQTNQSSQDLYLQFVRTQSSGLNGLKFQSGNTITDNPATGELQFSAITGGFFLTFRSNGAEDMRINTSHNVLIGSTTNVASSKFVIVSTTQGSICMPVMTTTQKNAISSPAEGNWVYDVTLHAPYYWNGSAWTTPSGANGGAYTPTISSVTNASSVVVTSAVYSVSGSTVHVRVSGTFTLTSNASFVTFSISLPSGLTSNASISDYAGTIYSSESPSNTANKMGNVFVNNSATTAVVTTLPNTTNGASNVYIAQFDYSL